MKKIIKWIKDVIKTKSLKVGIAPDVGKVKRKVTKYLQNHYNGETGRGYLSTIADNFEGVKHFSMDIRNYKNEPIERIMKVTKKDYYQSFGRNLVMIDYKRTNFQVNQ